MEFGKSQCTIALLHVHWTIKNDNLCHNSRIPIQQFYLTYFDKRQHQGSIFSGVYVLTD